VVMLRVLIAALGLCVLAPEARADATVALPLYNSTKDRTVDWVGESVAEGVLEALHSEGLVTLDRNDRAEACQRLALKVDAMLSRASVVKIGDELDASHAVYGSFEVKREAATKPGLRLTVRVLDLKKLRQTPEIVEEGLLEDLATLQNRVSWKVLNSIALKPSESEGDFLARRPAVRVDAMENYVRGLLAKTDATRHRFFTQAAFLDPKYSQPCFQLGLHYWGKEDYQQAARWFGRVARGDVHYMEATFYAGICRHYLAQYAAAETAFARVSEEVPLNEVFSNCTLWKARARASASRRRWKATRRRNTTRRTRASRRTARRYTLRETTITTARRARAARARSSSWTSTLRRWTA